MKKNKQLQLPEGFCEGCCYDNQPKPELNCDKVKCCYLVEKYCILMDGGVYPVYD